MSAAAMMSSPAPKHAPAISAAPAEEGRRACCQSHEQTAACCRRADDPLNPLIDGEHNYKQSCSCLTVSAPCSYKRQGVASQQFKVLAWFCMDSQCLLHILHPVVWAGNSAHSHPFSPCTTAMTGHLHFSMALMDSCMSLREFLMEGMMGVIP